MTSTSPEPIPVPDPPLADGVVRLRPWTLADLPEVVAACADPEISRFSPAIPYPYTDADFLGWLHSIEPNRLEGIGIDLAIVADDPDGCLLGAIGLHKFNRSQRTAETGYWLAADARGRGDVSRALRLVATWAFADLGIERLALTNDPDNHASQAVAARCGFSLEGRLRSHLLIRHSGERRDSLVWSLLPGELR